MKAFKNMTDEALNTWLEQACEKRDEIMDNISIALKEQKARTQVREEEEMKHLTTEEEKIKYFLFEDGNVTGKRFEERDKFWRSMGLQNCGYYIETDQVNLKVCLYKDRSTNNTTIEALNKVLPFVKAHSAGKRFGVFESTLSAHGVYKVLYHKGEWTLIKTTYGNEKTLKTFDTTEEMVEYVSQHHFYEESQ